MKTQSSYLAALCLLLAGLSPFTVPAADLPSAGTNFISGTLRFTNVDAEILSRLGRDGGDGMTAFTIYANADSPEAIGASKTFLAFDPLSQPYEITVAAHDVPRTYNVYAVLTLDGNYEEYWTTNRAATPLTSNSPPAALDLDECVALVELRYQDPMGQPVAALDGRALVIETATGIWRARYLAQPPGRTGNFLAVPTGVEIELSVEVDIGSDIYLDRLTHRETRVMTLDCDDKPVITLTIPDAGTLGRIVGNANLVGEIELATDGYQELLGRPVIKGRGPAGNQRYSALAPEAPGADMSRPFALEQLAPSTDSESWRVHAEMQFGDGYRFQFFQTPALGLGLNEGVKVEAGQTVDLADTFVMEPARLVGRIVLRGPPEFGVPVSALRSLMRATDFDSDLDGIPDGVGPYGIYGSYVILTGVDELAAGATRTAAGGLGTASFAGAFNPASGAFEGDYVTTVGMPDNEPGIWKYDGLNLSFYQPALNGAPYVDESLYMTEDTPWQGTLGPGETATNDLSYGFAEVCLRITSPASFFYPRVVNSFGYHTNYGAFGTIRNSYVARVSNASSPPYTRETATNEAVITLYIPEGRYTLHPAFSVADSDGGVSEVQLPSFDVSVVAGERLCIEECIQLVITPPVCSSIYGFVLFADAFACEATLTNLSLTTRPLGNPSVRLGYSDIRILEPVGVARTTLHTGHGLFPQFDNHPLEDYRDLLIIAEARDNKGRVATRQIVAHYDLIAPTISCPDDMNVYTDDPMGTVVEFDVTARDDRPEPLVGPTCVPASGSFFPLGETLVTCKSNDQCGNTNTCSFKVTVGSRPRDCVLSLARLPGEPPEYSLTWDCGGTLQWADSVEGPWTNLTGASSPHTVTAAERQRFFRICVSGDCGLP